MISSDQMRLSMITPGTLFFGEYELKPVTGELRRHGESIKLPPQPFKVLELLAGRRGEIVTRVEIRNHVWGDTFVDYEQGLNFCIRQIREVLGDTADAPRFIETLPRRGYRFVMPVTIAGEARRASGRVTRVIVLPFRMLRPDPETEFLAFSLPDAVTSSLSGLASLVMRSSMTASRFASPALGVGGGVGVGEGLDPKAIGVAVDVDAIVTGTLLRAGNHVRVATQLTDASSGTLLSSHSTEASLGNLFRVQDDLTQAIVASLSLPLTSREQQMLHHDVPASATAYEHFLRANQLSYDAQQWVRARDLYLRCVAEDPRYAPAWARLGRMHHVLGKYLETGLRESLDRAESAFRRALELNPDLPIAHKLFAQLEVDLGRAHDAMARLIPRARVADPELLAGLVSACRYCGLLEASVAAHVRAASLDSTIRTSVPQSWFLQGEYARVATGKIVELPYIVAISLSELGRADEALPLLRVLEPTRPPRIRDFIVAARTLLEGNRTESLAAVGRVVASDFTDPEGLFLLSRHLARLNEGDAALALLERVDAGGFCGFPSMTRDPWFDSLRNTPAFTGLLRRAKARHDQAATLLRQLGGEQVLGLASAG
jgi:DNA-binding winged helix-turn-helix (wHTH) protein/tetratricopeptide (TPR) repeat protein